jgi:hypothetical protein
MGGLSSRNIWISVAVAWGTAAVGAFIVRQSEEAIEGVLLVAFILGLVLLNALDWRELRRKEKVDQR